METKEKAHSLWDDALRNLLRNKVAVASFVVIVFYGLVALLAFFGVIADKWNVQMGESYQAPGADLWLGADIFGRDVLQKVIQGTQIALSVGLLSACIAVPIGLTLGALAGYFGGIVDEIIVWFYTTLSSVPNIMLLISVTLILGKGMTSVYLALGLTSWVSLCRMIRGEVMKHKNRDYIHAASAIGSGHFRKLFIHILPNVMHIVIIDASMQFQVAIKSEVILSYLGLGVQNMPSWGKMIDDAKLELARGVWWQLAGATFAMFFVVLAFNLLGDALRDALDPKLKGKD
jgi:ABC-type dipeptide/oligopeptide/nickel transport system permease subunit